VPDTIDHQLHCRGLAVIGRSLSQRRCFDA